MHLPTRSITTSMCTSKLDDLGLQLHLWVHLDLSLQLYLLTYSISASKWIFKPAPSLPRIASLSSIRWRPPSASPNTLNHGLQVHLWVTRSKPPSVFPNLLDHGLQVHLQTHSIKTSNCISEFTRSWPPSASPNSLSHGLQVHFWVTLFQPPSASPNSLYHGFKVHLWVAIARPANVSLSTNWSHPARSFLSYSILASKYIFKPALSQPLSSSLSSTWFRPPRSSPRSLDHSLQVHLPVHTITASKWISMFPHSASQGAPAIMLQYRLQPHLPYEYV